MLGKYAKILAPGLLVFALAPGSARGDDTSFFGRLFRLGGNSSSSSSSSPGSTSRSAAASDRTAPSPYGGPRGSAGNLIPPATLSSRAPSPTPAQGPISDGPATPDVSSSGEFQQRLSPRPRTSSAVTVADPLVTRMALGRSNDGSQFGMFLQIFADGTVIDSDGVHRLSSADLKPIVEAIQSGEFARVRGHCSTPSGDFVEHVHLVVFERRMGRLQAHSFSYSGNPQGCDHAVRHLHTVLEAVQAKLSRQAPSNANASGSDRLAPGTPVGTGRVFGTQPSSPLPLDPGSGFAPPLPDPGASATPGQVIPLTPLEPR
jgi:hypothetical protein